MKLLRFLQLYNNFALEFRKELTTGLRGEADSELRRVMTSAGMSSTLFAGSFGVKLDISMSSNSFPRMGWG